MALPLKRNFSEGKKTALKLLLSKSTRTTKLIGLLLTEYFGGTTIIIIIIYNVRQRIWLEIVLIHVNEVS